MTTTLIDVLRELVEANEPYAMLVLEPVGPQRERAERWHSALTSARTAINPPADLIAAYPDGWDRDDIIRWWNEPHVLLGGQAPREVWHSRMGRGAVLLQVGRMFGGGY